VTWSSLTGANGLPAGATAYPQATATGTPAYTSHSASATGQYQLASVSGGLLYVCANGTSATPTFTAVGMGAPSYYLPMEGAVSDVVGTSAPAVTGYVNYVTGIVGTQAVNVANTAGGTPSNFIRGTIPAMSALTVSGWVNFQTVSISGVVPNTVFSIGTNAQTFIYLHYINGTGLQFQFLNSSNNLVTIGSQNNIVTNIWYNFAIIYNQTGTCYFYVNNVLIGTAQGAALLNTMTTYTIGSQCHATYGAFNGYLDDLRIYNSVVTFSPIVPMNWNYTTVSSTGQYMMAAAASGGIFTSSNYGVTWSQVSSLITPGQVVKTNVPSTIMPNMTGLAAATWTMNGVTWSASASSSVGGGIPAYSVFNNTYASDTWAPTITYSQTGNTSGYYTAIQGIGNIQGDWLQIQSSSPLTMVSYQFATGNAGGAHLFKQFYIVGSTDGSTWYPIQAGNVNASPTTATFTLVPGVIQVNSMINQTFGSTTITGVPYPTTTTAYTYFRMVYVSSWSSTGYVLYGEWFVNFSIPAPLYVAPSASIASIAPQMTGLTTTTWSTSGVSWTASASSVNSSWYIYKGFNNTTGDGWLCDNVTQRYTNGSTNANAATTAIQTIGSIAGEWLQIQSSIPLVMTSFAFGIGPNAYPPTNTPKTYYIVGSNDGTTWYPIQYGNFTISAFTSISSYIIINITGTQTLSGNMVGSVATTAYSPYSTNSYSYFRLIGASIMTYGGASAATYMEVGEWYTSFTTATPTPAPSNTSQITVTPQQANLTSLSWTTPSNGITWLASGSSLLNTTSYSYYSVYNPITGTSTSFTSAGTYSSGTYTGTASTPIVGGLLSSPLNGEYIQIQSSAPLVMQSYTFTCAVYGHFQQVYYIVGSNDGTTWYPIHKCSLSANPFTAWSQPCINYLLVNMTGTQTLIAGTTVTATTTAYSYTTNAYTYFRMIATSLFSTGTYMEVEKWPINFTAATPNPISALTMTNTNMMVATSNTISPNMTDLTAYTWTINGVTWTTSASSSYSGNPPYYSFDAVARNNWGTSSLTYTPTTNSSGISNTFYTNGSSTITVVGDWLQLTSSVPLVMSSYLLGSGNSNNLPKTFYIVGSNDGTNWYAIQYGSAAAQPSSSTYVYVPGLITVNSNSVQVWGTSTLTTATFTGTTNAYTYFRFIGMTVFYASAPTLLQVGAWYINFQSTSVYSSANYGALWTNTVTAPTNATMFAISGKYILTGFNQTAYLYSNGLTGTYTTPTLTGINASINCASISASGQYMIIMTQGATNNVFYSTNYGATFTAYTFGSAAMTSCAISYDGSYVTVSNATTVYTLNLNTRGYTVTIGNQAGVVNQGLNAIAIGNQAGTYNQSANSIVISGNATVSDVYTSGLFVSPVTTTALSDQSSVGLLGYGTDNQVTQTGITVTANGDLTVSSLIAPSDTIAQGLYLPPSAQNSAAILRYFQKMTNAVKPSGVLPFWANKTTYSTVGTTPGSAAFVGGVLIPDGRVVFVPYSAATIGLFNPATNSYTTTGTTAGSGAFIGGVLLPDGRVLFVPNAATSIGVFTPATNSYTTYGTTPGGSAYVGGVLLPDGRVLFVPYNATTIGFFNPATNTYSTITPASPALPGAASGAYYGGVLLPDGRVLFVPNSATTIGLFDPITNTYSTTGTTPGGGAYVGGVLLPDGRVLFVPANGTNIGLFNPTTNTYSTIGGAPGSGAYFAGTLLPDGRVLFVPTTTTTIGFFNPTTNTYSTISATTSNNAYIGGVLIPDGRIIFIPFNATTIGILTTSLSVPRDMCLSPYLNKF
jgi:hypothetical protein